MFDFGFGELLLLAVIALVVLGPERLPVAARLAGLWIRKARAQWNAVKAEMENELADEELRRHLREASEAMREGGQQMRDLRDGVASTAAQMSRLPAPIAPPAQPHAGGQAATTVDEAAPDHAGHPPAESDPAQLSLLEPAPDQPHSDG